MPDIHVTLIADEFVNSSAFNDVVVVEKQSFGTVTRTGLDKIVYLPMSPYEVTLYLDADTYICGDLTNLFSILDHFDISAAHDTFRMYVKDYSTVKEYIQQIPPAFPMLNSGVILYKKSKELDRFFHNWHDLHLRNLKLVEANGRDYCADQTAFREALYFSDLRIATLPTEYNCRFVHPAFVNGQVQILHGPHPQLPKVAYEINKLQGNRVFLPEFGVIHEKNKVPHFINKWYLAKLKTRVILFLKKMVGGWVRRWK